MNQRSLGRDRLTNYASNHFSQSIADDTAGDTYTQRAGEKVAIIAMLTEYKDDSLDVRWYDLSEEALTRLFLYPTSKAVSDTGTLEPFQKARRLALKLKSRAAWNSLGPNCHWEFNNGLLTFPGGVS